MPERSSQTCCRPRAPQRLAASSRQAGPDVHPARRGGWRFHVGRALRPMRCGGRQVQPYRVFRPARHRGPRGQAGLALRPVCRGGRVQPDCALRPARRRGLCPPTRTPSRTAKTSRSSPPPRVPRRPVRRATEAGEVEPVTARSAAEVGEDAPRARSYLPPRAPRKPARSNRCRSTRSAPRAAGHARRTHLATRALADHGVAAGVPRATAAVPHVLAPERGCGQSPPTSPPPSEVTGAPPGYATAGRAHLPRGRVGMASSEVSRESLPAGAPPG